MIGRRKKLAIGGGVALIVGIVLVYYFSKGQIVRLPDGGSIRIYGMSFDGKLSFEHPGKVGKWLVKQFPSLESFPVFVPASSGFGSAEGSFRFAVCFLHESAQGMVVDTESSLLGGPPMTDHVTPYRLDIEDAFQEVRDSRTVTSIPLPGIDMPKKVPTSSGLAAIVSIERDYGPYVKLHLRRKNDPTNGSALATFRVKNEIYKK